MIKTSLSFFSSAVFFDMEIENVYFLVLVFPRAISSDNKISSIFKASSGLTPRFVKENEQLKKRIVPAGSQIKCQLRSYIRDTIRVFSGKKIENSSRCTLSLHDHFLF